MANQQNNPKMDFGFHAMIPRIIRTDYKNLTAVQKWLYVCLKDLCGNHGTCYRSLRALAEETGISTGMLSESIPLLHTAGLIHAEKKKRSTGGKEVWHITIVDIWIANGKAHPTKRSQNEQTLEEQEENVHTVNNNVHTVNKLTEERSQNEQECSLCETEVIEDKQEDIKAREDKQDSEFVVTANADANDTPAPSENTQETPAEQTEEKPKKSRAPRTPVEGQVTKAQFDAAFKVIDETLQDLHDNPDLHVLQSKAAKESVKALILAKGAPKTLALVIRDMWNEQNKDGTFWWREKGHMTVKAICEQYSSRAPHLTRQPAANNNKLATSAVDAMQTTMVGVSGLPITRSNGQKLRVVPPVRKPRRKVI